MLGAGFMVCPYSLNLAFATPGQLRCPFDRMAGSTQRNNALMGCGVRYATSVLASNFGKLNTLALSLAVSLIVITRHLQGRLEQ